MRLSQILGEAGKALALMYGPKKLKTYERALSFMPRHKVKHSLRVGETALKAGLPPEAVEAAILHDYIERGGNLSKLSKLGLSPRTVRIIQLLSLDDKQEGGDVLTHVRQMLQDSTIDQHDKNVAIIVKFADRIDNLERRIKSGKLSRGYRKSSNKLFKALRDAYTGEPEFLRHITRRIRTLNL